MTGVQTCALPISASHNPAAYNGIKLCLSGARPVGQESGLAWIKAEILKGAALPLRTVGKVHQEDLLSDYVEFLLSLFPHDTFNGQYQGRKMRIAIDAGNGMGGYTAPAVFKRLNAEVIEMYFELDGTFPNHDANPIEPSNLVDLQKAVKKHKADIGLAFDGDADRCFLVDENGDLVNPSALTALIATRELKRYPSSNIIYNLISSRAVKEVVEEKGGSAVRSRVGHSYIKKLMAETNAVFGRS